MSVRTDEVADGVFRLSTLVPEGRRAGRLHLQPVPDQRADEPLLFHTGPRHMFARHLRGGRHGSSPLASLRWISFGHVESDECGSMNQWLAAAPEAQVAHGAHRLHGLAERPRRPPAAPAGRRRGDRPRRQAGALDRHPARAARLGIRADVRGRPPARCSRGDLFTAGRRWAGADAREHRRGRRADRRDVQGQRADAADWRRPSVAWRRCSRRRWR